MTFASLFDSGDLSRNEAEALIQQATRGADDGELYLERTRAEVLALDKSELKTASYHDSQGFGLRTVAEERTGYAQSSEISLAALKRATESLSAVTDGYQGQLALPPAPSSQTIYQPLDPLGKPDLSEKIGFLSTLDAFARARDPRVVQVSANLTASHKVVEILRPDGSYFHDTRPLVGLHVSVIVESNGRRERGFWGAGGRKSLEEWLDDKVWQQGVCRAIDQACVNLGSVPGPAGETDVILAPGWGGILLHEAVGHGLEGDFNRKGTSAFSGMIGERVASPGVTVIDDGTLTDRRGSIQCDDEGTASSRTVLIEDGILKGYLQDRLNGRLMGGSSTGNGRRESFAHLPMPRMTNTFMDNGKYSPEEIIASVRKGVYVKNFGGGQVDITSGKFVFECTEAYKVEDGRIGEPIKSATLIGHGPSALTQVALIGNDKALDEGIGTCGKQGQGVPVGVGQPTLLIRNMTVGGTASA